jgi:carboxyl-terminal processing protease
MQNNSAIPKVDFRLLRNILLSAFLISVTFTAGYFFGYKGFQVKSAEYPEVTIEREVPPERDPINFSLFWQVWDTLDAKYYDKEKLIPYKMVYGAVQGMVAAVGDPYTVFLPPKENKVVQEDLKGNFEGVGIQIGFKGNQLAVVAPLPDSPAEDAGVESGDFIAGITDKEKNVDRGTVGITLQDAVSLIRGPAGSTVTLTLLREGAEDPIVVDIKRAPINVPSIATEFVGEQENVAHIKVLKYSADTTHEWEQAIIDTLNNPKTQGVIVDLRNNPGGYLQGAVDMASEFLEVGDVVVIEERGDGFRQEYKVERLGRLRNQKVVVLVNGGSASASEIFAGALRDQRSVKLVGQTTFGKGTIQEPQQIEGGAGLHITIARWLTPSGYWVNEKGLEPDVEVKDNPETLEDEQLQEAIQQILS